MPPPSPTVSSRLARPGTPALAHTVTGGGGRLLAIDVLRGLTVAAMLVVNDPGSWDAVYPPLLHATWHGCTPTDLIFPCFLFIVGVTTWMAAARHPAPGSRARALARPLRRAGLLFLIGVAINAVAVWLNVLNVDTDTLPAGTSVWDLWLWGPLLALRLAGVLQRIALCYLATAWMVAAVRRRPAARAALTMAAVVAALLLGYWALLMAVPVPGTGLTGAAALAVPDATLAAWVDRGVLDWGAWGLHLWQQTGRWDPEGVLSTLPAIGTCLLGALAGRWITGPAPLARRIAGLLLAGIAGIAAGLLWGLAFPLNKGLWTSSYVLFSAGVAATALGLIMAAVDLKGWRGWTRPWQCFGLNPILAYAGSELLSLLLDVNLWPRGMDDAQSTREAVYGALRRVLAPSDASLAYALLFTGLWFAVVALCARRGWVLKV